MPRATVVITDCRERPLPGCFDTVFAPFGGVGAVVPKSGTVYVKPNAVSFSPHAYTDPRVLEAFLGYLRDHGYARLAVMENCTGGNFTRLVFKVTGYEEICRRYGAERVYLDEGPIVEVTLRDEDTPTRIPRRLYEELIVRTSRPFRFMRTGCIATITSRFTPALLRFTTSFDPTLRS
jgi:uncharacterized protein (DUF362 family)